LRQPQLLGFLLVLGAMAVTAHAADRIAATEGSQETAAAPAVNTFELKKEKAWAITQGPCNGTGGSGAFGGKTFDVPIAMPVCAALQRNQAVRDGQGRFLDAYTGSNLMSWPGYPANTLKRRTDKIEMPDGSPFKQPWCYKKQITFTAAETSRSMWMDVSGLNYTGKVIINGKSYPLDRPITGPYTATSLDIAKYLKPGANTIQFEVSPPTTGSLATTFLDWNAGDPCKGMGLSHEPKFHSSGPVRISGYYVKTHLNPSGSAKVDVYVDTAGLPEQTSGKEKVTVSLDGHKVEVPLAQLRKDGKVTFNLESPKLWWPRGMGEPNLVPLSIRVTDEDGKISDQIDRETGLREVRSFVNENKDRQFQINGRDFQVRGAGWSGDVLGYESNAKKNTKLEYLADMGLNTVRFEGTMENSDFYRKADKLGLMVIGGFPCCTAFEANEKGKLDGYDFGPWTQERMDTAKLSLQSQLHAMREHPSFLGFFNGSDNAPAPFLESQYKDIYAGELHDPSLGLVIPRAAESGGRKSTFGESGVRMDGPYSTSPADFWYLQSLGSKRGPSYGFNSELGPGPSISSLSALKQMSPNAKWPLFNEKGDIIDRDLKEHAGTAKMGDLKYHYTSMCNRLGCPESMNDFMRKTQIMNYMDHAAEMESCNRNSLRPTAKGTPGCTGMIHWMGMNAYPTTHWNLMGYDMSTGGAYYGVKSANTGVKLQYSPDDGHLVLINHTSQPVSALQAEIKLYGADSKLLNSRKISNLTAGGGTGRELDRVNIKDVLAQMPPQTNGAVLTLDLKDAEGHPVSQKTYLLSSKPAGFDGAKGDEVMTPPTSEPSYQKVELTGHRPDVRVLSSDPATGEVTVQVDNTQDKLSLFNQLSVTTADGRGVWPQMWSDNFVTVHPKGSTVLKVKMNPDVVRAGNFKVSVEN
jgi:exo-1,4-beta-D-glucosaminidase